MKHECEAIQKMAKSVMFSGLPAPVLFRRIYKAQGMQTEFIACINPEDFNGIIFDARRETPAGGLYIDAEELPINYCPFCGERLSSDDTEG